jgi:multidrug resistance efflux pump
MKKARTTYFWFGHFSPHIMPVLVWLGVLSCVVVLFHHRSQRFEVLGIAQGQVRQIAATCTGRLKTLPVELFGKVGQGDTLAVIDVMLDDENTEAELAVMSAEIQHLQAELLPTKERLLSEATERETNIIADQRRFNVDVENVRLRILELKTLIETDRITAEDLALEVKIVEGLLEQDAVSPYELQKAKTQYNILAQKIEGSQRLLSQAEQNLKQSQQRQNEYAKLRPQHPSADSALTVIQKAIEVQEQRIKELIARREVLVLKSPIDGMVNHIQKGPGETILPGESILSITELIPREIVAYADENQAGLIEKRMAVELVKNSNPAQIARSQIVHLSSTIELIPQRLWRSPNVAQWGRAMIIKIPPGLKLLPGETVGIRGL